MSAQEKRAEQLKAIGIDESDISTEVIPGKGGATNKKTAMPGILGMGGKKPEEKGNFFRRSGSRKVRSELKNNWWVNDVITPPPPSPLSL